MSPELLFQVANATAVAGWLVLVLAWFSPALTRLVSFGTFPLLLALAYSAIVVGVRPESGGDYTSLAGVQALFTNPWAATAGWIHYLVFDLFIGSWMLHDAKRHNLSLLLLAPAWFLTFMVGPVGLLIYSGMRFIKSRSKPLLP